MLTFKVDGVEMPGSERNNLTSFTFNDEPIWSSNSGRSATADWVGDIQAEKNTAEITYTNMYRSDFNVIKAALPSIEEPFVDVEFSDEEGVIVAFKAYCSAISYKYGGVAGGKSYYESITFSLVGK